MKKVLRSIAKKIGWTATYHVFATYQRDSYVGQSVVQFTVLMSPWMHSDNFQEVVDAASSLANYPKEPPIIASITKLGI